jgi:wobble nucleotide-excising tRNase
MLNRLQLFRNVGQFDSVNAGANIPLSRVTLGYAENGRGKTTLAAILRSLATNDPIYINERHRLGAPNGPQIVIDCAGGPPHAMFQNGAWNRTLPEIAIFDDAFVDQNICSGLTIESEHRQKLHELILGAQGVALNQAVQTHVADVEEHNRTLRELGNAIPEAARFGIPVEDFCALPAQAAIEDDIVEAERALAAAGQQEGIRTTPTFQPYAMPDVDVDAIRNLLALGLAHLDQDATNRVQQHFVSLGRDGERWVAEGINKVPDGITDPHGKPCPFCAQDLGGSEMVAHYRAYFAAGYEQHKVGIDHEARRFAADHGHEQQLSMTRVIHQLHERRNFWAQFTEVPEFTLDARPIAEAWIAMRDAVNQAFQAKQGAPLDRIDLSQDALRAIATYREKAAELAGAQAALLATNPAIERVKEQAAAANLAALRNDLQRLRAIQSRHRQAIAPLCDDYIDARNAKMASEAARDAARVALDNYRNNIFPTYQNAINDCLRRFNAGFRLAGVTSQNNRGGSSCVYSVMINDQPVAVTAAAPAAGRPSFKNTLSAGDRNTLALAIFFASLEQGGNLANKIVVIDDPVSSLDEHRSLATVHEICQLSQRVAQVIALSHSKPFLCSVWEATDQTQRSALMFDRAPVGSTIRVWDVNQDLITEHDRRHQLLRDYVAGAAVDRREVARALRPTLEAFCRVAYPADFPPSTLLGPFLNRCTQRIGQPNQILNQADTTELDRLKDYGNLFHHDSNPNGYLTQNINDGQLLDFTRRTVAFATRS